MLQQLPSFKSLCGTSSITVDDVTVLFAVRLHEGNPWVLERLARLREYYSPLPPVLVVDFGSSSEHSDKLHGVCERDGFAYEYVDDTGTFCLAKARNIAAAKAQTPFLFFCDADCFGERSLFQRLVDHANDVDFGRTLEQIVNLPVYHFDEEISQRIWNAGTHKKMSKRLRAALARHVYDDIEKYSYADPSSNFFLISKSFFNLLGGYNETFRGHGSEDFEFFVRVAHLTHQFPHPEKFESTEYSPVRDDFYGPKAYLGVRRFCELMAFQAETAGLRICHLYHPRGNDAWYQEYDKGKSRYHKQVSPILKEPAKLLEYDWMPRDKTALVLLKHRKQYEFFLPLRVAGYRLRTMLAGDKKSEAAARKAIESGTLDAVAVFNPYMNSHRHLQPFIEQAKEQKLPLIVIDRGMLPESWFFAEDMPYADSEFLRIQPESLTFTDTELQVAVDYIARLRTGAATLESNGAFKSTLRRREPSSEPADGTVFVPLQLQDDVAVTKFDEGYTKYKDFVAELNDVVGACPDVRFLIKPHPLSKLPLNISHANAVICDSRDNVHALIELADAVVCYNSGVGFLAMCHDKPVVTIGNAFYNIPKTGHRVDSFGEALRVIRAGNVPAPQADVMRKYVAWLIFRKYAFCSAESVIRELAERRVHDYQHLAFYQLPWKRWSYLRASSGRPVGERSYAAGKVGINITSTHDEKPKKFVPNGPLQARPTDSPAQRKLRKLMRDPKLFFRDAKSNFISKMKS